MKNIAMWAAAAVLTLLTYCLIMVGSGMWLR
jgi:hypothetical protein